MDVQPSLCTHYHSHFNPVGTGRQSCWLSFVSLWNVGTFTPATFKPRGISLWFFPLHKKFTMYFIIRTTKSYLKPLYPFLQNLDLWFNMLLISLNISALSTCSLEKLHSQITQLWIFVTRNLLNYISISKATDANSNIQTKFATNNVNNTNTFW